MFVKSWLTFLREWILGHPYSFPPSEIRSAIHDDDGTGTHILDHPSVRQLFDSIVEIAPGVVAVESFGFPSGVGLQNHTPPT